MKRLIVIACLVLAASAASAEEKRYAMPLDHSPSFGPDTAAVTVVEFLDYQ